MQKRKDHKGRVLKDGETYRKNDGLYMYRWIGGDKKRHAVYCSTLEGLREKKKKFRMICGMGSNKEVRTLH